MVTTAGWLGVHPLVEKDLVLQLASVKITGNVDALLGHNCLHMAQEMASAIDHEDLSLHHPWQSPGKCTKDFGIQKMLCASNMPQMESFLDSF